MINGKKIVSLVPLRGGSKSIPYKNIKEIAGKPLCYFVLKAATASKYIDEVWVSTDDAKIKEVVASFGLPVKIIDRPAEFAGDTSSTESVMAHFARNVSFDILNLIQATTPFTIAEDLDGALEQFVAEKDDSLLSGVLYKKFYWTLDGKPLGYEYLKRPRRQEYEGVVNENGAFYLTSKEIWEKHKNRLGGKIGIFLQSQDKAVDIDEPEDWDAAEKLLRAGMEKKV